MNLAQPLHHNTTTLSETQEILGENNYPCITQLEIKGCMVHYSLDQQKAALSRLLACHLQPLNSF